MVPMTAAGQDLPVDHQNRMASDAAKANSSATIHNWMLD
jgi:hypothetical protein